MTEFELFHKYNKLVRRNLVKPLTCKSCGFELVTGNDAEGEFLLRCFTCASHTYPGANTVGNVRAVVTEHFIND